MKNRIVCALFAAIVASPAIAETTLKGGHVACVSENLWTELTNASAAGDERAINYLLNNGCFVTKSGIPVSVLDRSIFSGTAKVRAYVGERAVVIWTELDNLIE